MSKLWKLGGQTKRKEKHFEMKLQEGYAVKDLNFRIFQSPLGFSDDHTDNIMELVNEWSPSGKCRNVDTPFREDYLFEK